MSFHFHFQILERLVSRGPWAVKIDKCNCLSLRADETKFEFNSGALATRESGSPANSLHFSYSPVRLSPEYSL